LLDEIGVPDIKLTKIEVQDLEHIDQLTQAQNQMERLKDIEAEIVDTSKWNHDASKDLLNLTTTGSRIPFETRPELFNLCPTANDQTSSKGKGKRAEGTADSLKNVSEGIGSITPNQDPPSKGKGRAVGCQKRSIYHLLPEDAKESWLGLPGESNILEMNETCKSNNNRTIAPNATRRFHHFRGTNRKFLSRIVQGRRPPPQLRLSRPVVQICERGLAETVEGKT
jgi:hypothetical protein